MISWILLALAVGFFAGHTVCYVKARSLLASAVQTLDGAKELQDDGSVRCKACGSLAEHTMRGWFCTGSERNKNAWVRAGECK